MKTLAILKSAINVKRINNVKSKISQSERCLNKAKARQIKASVWDCANSEAQPVYYFEDLNILGLPKWM